MGMAYSAAKMTKPEAWVLGKDNTNSIWVRLFPVAQHNMNESIAGFIGKIMPAFYIMGQKPFVVSEQYRTREDFAAALEKVHEEAGFKLDDFERQHYLAFYDWAGDDAISVIGDFEYAHWDRDLDYLKSDVRNYVYMDSWEGKPGRPAMESDELCEMCDDEGVVTDGEGNERRCPCQDE